MIPKFSDAVTIDWERRDFAFMTVLTVQFCASMQYHIKDGDEVDYEEIKDLVVEQLRLEVANSAGGMLATDERETLERRIDELCQENERLRADQAHWELGNCPSCPNIADLQEALEQNAKLRELVDELYPLADYGAMDASELDRAHDLMRELGVDA